MADQSNDDKNTTENSEDRPEQDEKNENDESTNMVEDNKCEPKSMKVVNKLYSELREVARLLMYLLGELFYSYTKVVF